MNVDRTDTESGQKVSKTFMKGGDEKGVNYIYPVEWINPKGETQKCNIMIKAEIFLATLFIETREADEGTWLYFKDPLKQEQNLLYQGDTFDIDSLQYLFDRDQKTNILTIVKFSDSITAKIVHAGNKIYLTSKLDRKRNLVVQLKNRTKQIDNFQLFETNHRNLFYTKKTLTATEQNFFPTDISETDLRDIKLEQLFVWDFRVMFENLKQIELLSCRIERLHRAMIITKPINGNSHQVFLNQQNALGLHAERVVGILYVNRCAKVIVHIVENHFCTEEVPIRVSSDNSSERNRYTKPISSVFCRNFTLINCNPMYTNALELQNGSWITYGRQIQLIDKPNDMPNHRINVNCQLPRQWKVFFNDMRARRLRQSRKTTTGFPGTRRLI